jgi:hypothetical protein
LQVAAVKYSADSYGKLTEIDAFNHYVRYEKHISPAVTAINGIKDDMVRNADPAHSVLLQLAEFCGNTFVALLYNAPFTVAWLKWGHIIYGIPFEPIGIIDAYRVVQDVCGSAKESLKLRAVVEEVSEKTGITIKGNFNDALHDAMCVGKVYEYYWPSFSKVIDMFPHGKDYPQIISVQKLDPDANEPLWKVTCRFYGEVIFDSYTGTFSNEFDCFERLDVNALETELLKYFRKFSFREIK